ncbi:replicative DNA helicase [Brevundimonas sp. BAL450]|uniref:Replicative DNA helicase n=1 Tax=Brevundimonas abyssalis TAR-001 TaxID=1391729 RepID=A0A8E0KHT6_9CAUL|nr:MULTISPECIES: replicative DNA helicase [Brevundimonas]MBG7614766.1 replicative DNA helicase [Brevundimonas sp. BAL450]GAD58433.1 replicative DNA helicase [Brevundimonas abyssalis TAR-001]
MNALSPISTDARPVAALPHNLEAEQALLGSLMFDNAVFERLSDRLRGSHFYEPFHQRLFDAIEDHVRQGMLAEPTILMERFKTDPAFQEFGGLRYLADLVDRAPPGANAPDYARLVYDLALRRDLIRIGGDIIKEAPDPETAALEQIEQAEQSLYNLAETGQPSSGFVSFGHALAGAVEMASEAYQRDGKLAGLATYLDDLDQKLGGLHPSDLLILAGRPSMGKTALATNIAFNVARNYRWEPTPEGRKTVEGGVVAFYSLEMSAEQLAMRILADASGVSSDRLRKGEIDASDFGRIRDAAAEIGEAPLYIDATGGLSLSKLAARARRLKRMEHGLDLIVVDYLQLITVGEGNGQKNRVQEVSEITGGLKALAKELSVPILALSQLSRQVESREDKRPQLSDLRESGSIEQDADAVMFVYRESYYLGRTEPREGTEEHLKWQEDMDRLRHQAEVVIGKQRHGPIGIVKLSFDEDTTRFGNLAQPGRYEPN